MVRLLATLLEEFKEKLTEVRASTPRHAAFPEAKGLIKVAIGMRRAGKTYFALQKVLELLNDGVPLESILYINFEDDRLLPMDYKTMGELIDSFYTLYPENYNRICYIFLDEVQNIPDWALVVRRVFDSKQVQLFLTGSSAKLLSKEIATSLRGRCIETEIWPFSFSEYLDAHAVVLPKKPYGKRAFDEMGKHLLDYMTVGGFPAVQFFTPTERLQTLQGYVETVIFRDVVDRYKITNISLLRYTINALMKNVGAPFAINKFYNDIKSQGYQVSKDTLYSYLSYVEDAYLLFAIPHYSESGLRKTAPKRIYIVDNGLLLANTFAMSDDVETLFKNVVFLELKRQGKELFYYKTKNGYEVDFVVTSKSEATTLLQVAYDLSDPKTRKREERALKEVQDELGFAGKIVDWPTYLAEGVTL